MNRLILLGNGFDLAHGLKTSYNDFIKWYFKKCLNVAVENSVFEGDMISIERASSYFTQGPISDIDKYVDMLYDTNLANCENEHFKVAGWLNNFVNPFRISIKSRLLKDLFTKCSYKTWVEVENDFYVILKDILKTKTGKDAALKELNDSLGTIIQELEHYLSEQKPSHIDSGYSDIFNSPFEKGDIVSAINDIRVPEKTMILNFNYTSTVKEYFKPNPYDHNVTSIEVNYIHGKLNKPDNPIVFGFGDELDEDYRAIELETTKGFLKFIKSFWYFKTTNYHNLLRFIEADKYQVFILGHSCGLSDRTMLNMLFEHQNCESVKIFFYKNESHDNYEELTYEISKHFKDKSRMRRIIVPKSRSIAMPQVAITE